MSGRNPVAVAVDSTVPGKEHNLPIFSLKILIYMLMLCFIFNSIIVCNSYNVTLHTGNWIRRWKRKWWLRIYKTEIYLEVTLQQLPNLFHNYQIYFIISRFVSLVAQVRCSIPFPADLRYPLWFGKKFWYVRLQIRRFIVYFFGISNLKLQLSFLIFFAMLFEPLKCPKLLFCTTNYRQQMSINFASCH